MGYPMIEQPTQGLADSVKQPGRNRPMSIDRLQIVSELLVEVRQGQQGARSRLLDCLREILEEMAPSQVLPSLRGRLEPGDIVQEALLAVHRSLDTFRGNSQGEIWEWLRTIVDNKFQDAVRTINRHCRKQEGSLQISLDVDGEGACPATLADPERSGLERLVEQERAALVRSCVESLRITDQQVLQLRDVEGKTYREIGEVLGISEEAARNRCERAREALKELLRLKGIVLGGLIESPHPEDLVTVAVDWGGESRGP